MSDLAYTDSMINEIRELLLNARQKVATHINTELLSTYWNVGRIIVKHEQSSNDKFRLLSMKDWHEKENK